MEGDYTIVSSKNHILLLRNKVKETLYRIQFKVESNLRINPCDYIDFDIYNDMLQLNDDMLDDVVLETIENEPQSRKLMIQIKPFGEAFGGNGKYIITKITKIKQEDKGIVGLIGSNIPLSETNFTPFPTYTEMICSYSNLISFWNDQDNSMMVQYDFILIDPTFENYGLTIPRSVTDLSALLIKKLFLRMKEFKERQIKQL